MGYGGYGYSGYGYPGYGRYGYGGYGYGGYYGLGAVRLEVVPRHAQVFVDGYYAGVVNDFDGVFQRLRLDAGPHEIAIEAPGYEPLVFQVRIVPGETIKYRGQLVPLP